MTAQPGWAGQDESAIYGMVFSKSRLYVSEQKKTHKTYISYVEIKFRPNFSEVCFICLGQPVFQRRRSRCRLWIDSDNLTN